MSEPLDSSSTPKPPGEVPEREPGRALWGERLLIVDPDDGLCAILTDFLTEKGYEPRRAPSAADGLLLLQSAPFPVVLVGLGLPDMGGLDMLNEIKRISADTEVIILAGEATVDTAVKASRLGAYDYLRIPLDSLDQVWLTVRRAIEKRSLFLRNRKLLDDMELRNRKLAAAVNRLTSLIDAGRAMSGILTISEVLDFFIGQVVKELDADRASLMLLDETSGDLTIAASRGLSEELIRKAKVRLGDGVSGWVAESGKPILVKDVRTDPRARYRNESDMMGSFISSPIVLSVPILFQEKVLGVINVTNRRSGGTFGDDDVAYLYGLAGQAAVAIENAHRYEEFQKAFQSLKEARDQVVAVERLKALGQMAAGVAHDFNNILNSMLGRVELLQVQAFAPSPDIPYIRNGLALMEKICDQGAETVLRIQEIGRIRKDISSGVLDLNAVVRNTLEMTRSKWSEECGSRGIRIDVRQDLGEVPTIAGNPMEMTQVVSNLVFNAVEAMPRGGELALRTSLDDGMVVLDVSDTGTGIAPEIKDRIFEPFFTTKKAGQGLGMCVVYSILERHGGKISVESKEGAGSAFRITLPVRPIEVEPDRPETRACTKPRGPARVLIIEDEDLNREIFAEYASLCGHKVVSSARGADGLALLESERFDLVITDLSMPGMSGWEVAKSIKNIDPGIPVILLTGWAIQYDESRTKAAGIDYVVSKPCSLEQFRKAIQSVLPA